MTYGWAFLVITATIAGLVALDPLGAAESEVERCRGTESLLRCDERRSKLGTGGGVSLVLHNTRDEAVSLGNIALTRIDGAAAETTCSAPRTIRSGEEVQILCYGNESLPEDQASYTVEYEYWDTKVGPAYTRTAEISVQGQPADNEAVLSDLVAHWRFEGNGDDATGNGFDAVSNGNVFYTEGVTGQAARFEHDKGYFSVPYNESYHFEDESFSIAMWVRPTIPQPSDANGKNGVFGSGRDGGYLTGIRAGGDKLSALTKSSSKAATAYFGLQDNTWTHLAYVFNGSTGTLYADAQAVSSDTGVVEKGTYPLWIGRANQGGWEGTFDGSIDDLRLYGDTLTEAEVEELATR